MVEWRIIELQLEWFRCLCRYYWLTISQVLSQMLIQIRKMIKYLPLTLIILRKKEEKSIEINTNRWNICVAFVSHSHIILTSDYQVLNLQQSTLKSHHRINIRYFQLTSYSNVKNSQASHKYIKQLEKCISMSLN